MIPNSWEYEIGEQVLLGLFKDENGGYTIMPGEGIRKVVLEKKD
ncbi:hypothetical protein [Methanolapillus ohkumae]